MPAHPISRLRDQLRTDFVSDLPPGVHPVHEWCAEPQFFPGASGLLSEASWSDVKPTARGVTDQFLPAPHRGVVVIGHNLASLDSYNKVLSGEINGFEKTWRCLRRLLADVSPREVFLTNAYIGLHVAPNDTTPPRKTRDYSRRCQDLMGLELELFNPRLVVCLGGPAARMLAKVADGLEDWSGQWNFQDLENSNARTVPNCTYGENSFTAVVVQHPAARRVDSQARQLDTQRITHASQPPN